MRMHKLLKLTMLATGLALLFSGLGPEPNPPAAASPDVGPNPVQAGCYLATPSVCRLHVAPFTIAVDAGERLAAFQIQANGSVLYDFKTDMANPPLGDYVPSLVRKDFAARCSQTYAVTVLAQDTGDQALQAIGSPDAVTCPVGTNIIYLPVIDR
jgi:hypothetical protein